MTGSVFGTRVDVFRATCRWKPGRLLLPMLVLSAALTAEAGQPGCLSPARNGHCIAVKLNGQATVKLSKKTKRMLEPLDGLRFGGNETRCESAFPVRGALEVNAE